MRWRVKRRAPQQIEILRGPAALLYGSGAIGGLVNVVDGRIPTTLSKQLSGEAEVKYGAVNQEKSASFFLDRSIDSLALHFDGNSRDAGNYKIPGFANVNGTGAIKGTLPSSFSQEKSLGLGASVVQFKGALRRFSATHGRQIWHPTDERSYIDLRQTRLISIAQSSIVFDFRFLEIQTRGDRLCTYGKDGRWDASDRV